MRKLERKKLEGKEGGIERKPDKDSKCKNSRIAVVHSMQQRKKYKKASGNTCIIGITLTTCQNKLKKLHDKEALKNCIWSPRALQQVLVDRQANEGQEREPSHNNRGTICEMSRSLRRAIKQTNTKQRWYDCNKLYLRQRLENQLPISENNR